jgi:signal transduction histidine kinase/DNA-binding response OmpR family regulator
MTATLLREDEPILRVASRVGEVVFDPSGVVWVATGGSGLLQLRPSPLRVIGTADGLPNGNVYPILQDKDGQFWIGTFGDGVVRLGSDPFRPAVDEGGGFTLSLYQDRDGSIWVGRFGPTCRIVRARCVVIDLPALGEAANGVRVMHEDRQGRLWLGGNNGLAMGRGAPGARTWERIISSDSLPAHPVRTILELRDGEILFGTQGDGVLRYASDGRFEVFGTEQGLPSGNVRDLHEDATGYVWIALEDRGLCRLDRHGSSALGQAALACVDTRAGLYHDGLHRLLEDAQGRFWFNTNNGIFHVDKSALNAYLDGAIPAISSIGYTEADGMLHREGNGGMQPAGIKARNGDLWFPTRNGVVVVDPSAIPVPDPPYVALEQVRVAGTTRAVAETLALRTVRDFTVQYTALEFRHPDAVRFQYRLTGYDGEWQYAADARTTTYTNLAPGAYVFEVRAKSGLRWGEPARMIVTRSGFMYEQTWFFAAMSLLVLGTGYLAYRARMRRIAAHNAHLEQVVAARTAELRSKTEELQHANSLKSRFLANITHEFRTPLTLTFGPIDDLLSGRFTLDEAARPHLERARSNGRRLLRLINQLLDLSRLDANALELHPERHDLANHLRQLAALFSTLAAERQMQLIVQLPERARDHVYDADVLERVVLNLLSNAFKFTKPGGKVSLVLAYDDNGTARIEVVDTGPGIPEEHIPHLFDRFYQVESATTRAHEGSGIGLALVKELVELHGGDIAVASTVGFGTSFTVRLPSREAQTSAARAPARDATANRERGSTGMYRVSLPNLDIDSQVIARADRAAEAPIVMVVEDNADMRAYIRSHLEDDFDLIEAANGRDAFALATEQVPDLVLSDVMMPDIDGLQLCAMLKADEKTSHIPILLLTARSQVEDRIQGFESGADGYLSKPFNGEELRVRVRTLVEERRRLRARFGAMTTVTERDSVNDARESAAPPTLPPREAEFLEKVRKAIDEQLSDSQFGVDRLAEEMFMSPRQLYRKVEAVTGETPAGFIRARRMQRAKALLSTGRYSVKEVAYQVGFKSRPSFSAAYRQAYGVSPSDRGTGGRE